jgi:hypothetical protein
MIKKILLTLGLMLSANAWADGMDNYCQVEWAAEGAISPFIPYTTSIRENC